MSTASAATRTAEQVLGNDKIVSSDSHIMEPEDLWEKKSAALVKGQVPEIPAAELARREARRLESDGAPG
jgi:hypothetical protein